MAKQPPIKNIVSKDAEAKLNGLSAERISTVKNSPEVISAEDKRLAATAVVDAAIWSQYARGVVSLNDADREFLIRLMTANPQLTGSLFEKGL